MDTSYQIEPELRTSVRQAFWTSEARETRKRLIGLLLATLLIGGFLAYRDLSDLHALLRRGQAISAQVTGKHETHGKSTSYRLDYNFYGGGEWVNDTDDVPYFLYNATPVGDTLRITYLPSNPSIHRLGDVDALRVTKRESNWFIGVGMIAGIFLLIQVLTEYSYRRQMRLAIAGVPITGKIVSCEPPPKDSKTTTYTVKYAFADLSGDTRMGSWNAPEARGKQLQPGDNITILCDADNPNNYGLYMALNAVQVEGASSVVSSAS